MACRKFGIHTCLKSIQTQFYIRSIVLTYLLNAYYKIYVCFICSALIFSCSYTKFRLVKFTKTIEDRYQHLFTKGALYMKNEQQVLQIKHDSQTLLRSIDVEEELTPLDKFSVIRNLDNDSVAMKSVKLKHRYIVRSNHPPDISLLYVGMEYEVCPTIVLKESKNAENKIRKMDGTLETKDDFIFFRPVFNMILIGYKTNNSKDFKWILEFEEA